jgi:hypothetical protein
LLSLSIALVASAHAATINAIQGRGTTSPLGGTVQTVDGIVTLSAQGTGGLGGFYLQSTPADTDADLETSEGLFVANTSFPVVVGEVVRVTGTVAEAGTAPNTQTQLTNVTGLTHLAVATLPTPVAVTLPFASTTFAERYEGMLVTFAQKLTVTDNFDLGHFGELTLAVGRLPAPTNIVAPGPAAVAQDNANFLASILLNDASNTSYRAATPYLADSAGLGETRRAGSTVTGLTGVLDERFGLYLVEPTTAPAFADENPRGDPPAVGGTLRVALSNVLNFFNGPAFPTSRGADSAAEFDRQRAKIVAGLNRLGADILGLTEIENDGFASGSALADLVAALNAAAPVGTTYAAVDASGADNGTDAIHCAFIYRTQTVELVGAPAALTNQYFTSLARPPLAQTFRERGTGEVFTICLNHFRSKSTTATSTASTDGRSPNPNLDQGDGQGVNAYLRKREAETLAAWLATDPTHGGDPDVLIIGDLNAYAKEDALTALGSSGYTNLTERFEGAGGYSYAFNGAFGHLDHALANASLLPRVVGATTWHVNADEPVWLDYNVENKTTAQQALNTATPYHYSDHDPVLVGLTLRASTPTTPTTPVTPSTPSSSGGGSGGGAPSALALVLLPLLMAIRACVTPRRRSRAV